MDLPILGRDRITSAVQTLPVSRNKLLSKQMLQKLDKHRVQLISPRIVTCLSRCRCIAYTYPLYSIGLGLSRQAWIWVDAHIPVSSPRMMMTAVTSLWRTMSFGEVKCNNQSTVSSCSSSRLGIVTSVGVSPDPSLYRSVLYSASVYIVHGPR